MFRLKEEAARCLLCLEGACTAACEKGVDPARAVRAIRFENEAGAGNFIDKGVCYECTSSWTCWWTGRIFKMVSIVCA